MDAVMRKETNLTTGGYTDRPTRIGMACEALLTEADGCVIEVVITDLSSRGFQLQSNAKLEPGEEVTLTVPKQPPMRAIIRWTRGCSAGGIFLDSTAA